MRRAFVIAGLAGLAVWFLSTSAADDAAKPKRAATGIDKRVPWTTSRVKGSPEPPPPYRSEPAFPKLQFNEPLELTAAPGSNRLFVAERRGKLFSFLNDAAVAKPDLLLDVKKTVYGLAIHPKFQENGYIFVTYVLDPDKDEDKGTRLVRFTVDKKDPPTADLKSEKLILEWPSGGHNGGCLRFGPDGYLYISTGDGSGIADGRQTGQDLSDLLGALLRIDVDKQDGDKNYAIPADNPFVKTEGARPENYAYGLRQAWKFSFDKKTGDLWAGEVGQDLWEMVYKVVKGGNYGWSIQEGAHPFRPERKKGPTPILPPIVEQPHSIFRSITGGYLYHGKRLKELQGAYIYADYDTGKFWALRHDGKKVTYHEELADTPLRIVAFGEDNRGEIYHVDFIGGGIHRLVKAPKVERTDDFPRKLSETGLFTVKDGAIKDHTPAPGLVPYSVNAALWSDHAYKERFLALPGNSQIEFETITYPQPAPGAPPGWRFPDGTVVVKTFSLEMEAGNPKSRRRLETRILHFEQTIGTQEVGDQFWKGYTYIWNDTQTDAELADIKGVDRTFTIKDAKAQGGERKQTWHFPSRAECTTCHTTPAKYVLGVNTLQFNKDHDYNGVIANQLSTLEHLGMFTKPLPKKPDELPRLVDYEDARQDLDKRARAYLHANCAHCHMKWGGGNADFQLIGSMPLKDLGIIDVRPGHGTFELRDPRLVVPGDPERSLIHFRMQRLGLGRMPHIASNLVDEPSAKLIHDWIKQLK